jgi:hypothetical protein
VTDTPIKIGMVIRPKSNREQDEMLVQWIGQDSNRVLVAGWCAKQLSVDGQKEPSPTFAVYSDYDYGKGFVIV